MSIIPGTLISHRSRDIAVQVLNGHFATRHSHVNYYIDLTQAKYRLSMAREVASELAVRYISTSVDTIICMEGTKMIGAFMADELSRQGIMMLNRGNDINVISPELDNGGQIIFRENNISMVRDRSVLLLASSVSTGETVNRTLDCLRYYGGSLTGICALFCIKPEIYGYHVNAVFKHDDIPDYRSFHSEDCVMCAKKQKLDGIINAFGYSRL